ncbi:hypothetical protein H8D83_00290 [Candidatus Woesearchaeota archaeon]|nr:hypothetical protein [Candidatus Woesearchaeota archaeon]MBL7050689.1 hypothetical protein [Candidatus Woesearchaeota archaeon]
MKILLFDTGPIISMTMNHIIWSLKLLKKQFKGKFYITEAVKKELIDKPLRTKKFKLEALQTLYRINAKTLEIKTAPGLDSKTDYLLKLANTCFKYDSHYLKIVQYAEIETLALALIIKADAIVIDEKTTRLLVEDPNKLEKILSYKIHRKVSIDQTNLKKFITAVKGVNLIRSAELVSIAFELGLLDKYISNRPNAKKELLEALLWGIKLEGCAISEKEIRMIDKLERKNF